MLPPADGYFENVERDETDQIYKKAFDRKATKAAAS